MGLPLPALAAPKSEAWPRWGVHVEASTEKVDHAPWTAFLARYLAPDAHGINRLAYGKVAPADKASLAGHIARVSKVNVDRLRRDEQKAFWINLYNAVTVNTVLDHYPVTSIRDISISPGLFARGPWGAKLVDVNGEQLSLDDIEHRILRPLWTDPRVHYGLNCAALGCPNLRPAAFEGTTVNAMLDEGAREFINHPRAVRVERGRLFVSSIYVWFQSDFGSEDSDVIDHLRKYAAPELKDRLETIDQIAGDTYDWSLNDQAAAQNAG